MVVLRDKKQIYQQAGRKQSLEESIKKDKEIITLLDSNHIIYGTYYHKTINIVCDNIIKNFRNEVYLNG